MPPPKKRKRDPQECSNDDKGTTNLPSMRCDCLYFKDGNIALIAQDTAFRVHKGVLALHSDVFRNMFEDVNQPEDAEVFDGCSVVRVSDESEAMETFLKALYMIEPIRDAKDPGVYFPRVLRLATKYLCNTIRRHALDAFRCKYFPDTLPGWDTRDDSLTPDDIIGLARDIKAEILLPAAFYSLCRFSFPAKEMHPDDVVTYFMGKAKLGASWPEFFENQMTHHKKPPCQHSHCREGWRIFSEKKTLEALKEFQEPWTDPLAQFNEFFQALQQEKGLCAEAKRMVKKSCRAKREEIWNKLPEMFGIGSWATLRAADGSCGGHVELSDSSAVSAGDEQ